MPKPKYQTVDQNFHAQLDSGEIVIPLTVKTKLYRQIIAAGDAIIQLVTVLDGLDLKKELDTVDDLEVGQTAELAEAYFEAFNKFMGASLGESRGSSIS